MNLAQKWLEDHRKTSNYWNINSFLQKGKTW